MTASVALSGPPPLVPANAVGSARAPVAGYLHPSYARSLSGFGAVRPLPASGGWLLVRSIPGSDRSDALAGYRHLYCRDWGRLGIDLDDATGLVSVTAVTEPMAPLSMAELRRCFDSLVRPYKDHYLVDLRHPTPSRNNRRRAIRARAQVKVVVDTDPVAHREAWERLFAALRVRHRIRGLAAFSSAAFQAQLSVPGCVTIRGVAGGETVSMVICYVMGDIARAHLAASNDLGYRLAAAYALHDVMIEEFAGRGIRWLDLGSTAGLEADTDDGLSVFKRGWATTTRPSYLCGRVYDRGRYRSLSAEAGVRDTAYFPAYRTPRPG